MGLLSVERVVGMNPSWFWKLVMSFMHFTACRRRQVVELRWKHVLWQKNGVVLASEGSKSRREWEVPLPKWFMAELRSLMARHTESVGHDHIADMQVFCLPLYSERHKSNEMLPMHIALAVRALGGHLGFVVSPHRIRHTSATKMLEVSRDLKSVSEMLGHSDVAFTANTYIHPALSQLRRAQRGLPGYDQA